MKKITFTLVLLILVFSSSAQNIWTKDDRNNLYQEFMSSVGSKYKNVNAEQKESIALCAMTTTTEKYTKQDFAAKIEIELKRIYESQIGVCAKNIGVELVAINVNEEAQLLPVSESDDWSKQDKEGLSKNFNEYITKYTHLNENQTEKLELCFINEICKKYSKKQFNELISLELKQTTDNLITKCATNLSIDLTTTSTKQVISNQFKKDMFFGTWKTDNNFSISFNENGTFLKIFNDKLISDQNYRYIQNQSTKGDWFIDSKGIITLNESYTGEEIKLLVKSRFYETKLVSKYKIDELVSDYFKIILVEGSQCCSSSNNTVIQGNRSE